MKISLNWLKQYVDIPADLDPKELALKLSLSTVEVEAVVDLGNCLQDVVVGRVAKITKHPSADKLSVAEIDIKKQKLQVVFGQMANVEEGDLVPVAIAPTTLPSGALVETKMIRGIQSQGMLCLDSELMAEGQEVLTRFPKETTIGSLVKDILSLDDIIFDIDNKSITHRPDLWGHYGLAREVASLLNKKLKDLKTEKISQDNQVDLKITIEDKDNCSRYLGLVLGGISIEPSPFWLRRLLTSVGVRPVNNVVDITNYVMLELGRPSHAFDRKAIIGDAIIVRRAHSNEKFIGLDGVARRLSVAMCLVCDSERPVDLAGIIGGQNSQINESTSEIILELANFNPTSIRKTANQLGLRTEAAARFEKSLDPTLVELGLMRLVTLIKELIPAAKVISKIVDVNYETLEPRTIELPLDFLHKKIGLAIPKKEVINILESLSFVVQEKKDNLIVTPPSFRVAKDIASPEDLVEEVARIYGYSNIAQAMPTVPMTPPAINEELAVERRVKNLLTKGLGVTEVANHSFTSLKKINLLGLKIEDHLELLNSFSEEQQYLRGNLLENLLQNLSDNVRFYDRFNIFEIGRVYANQTGHYRFNNKRQEFLPKQDKYLAGLVYNKEKAEVFYRVKGLVEAILENLEISYEFTCSQSSLPWLAFGPGAHQTEALGPRHRRDSSARGGRGAFLEVRAGQQAIGYLGLLNQRLLDELSINGQAAVWELNFNELVKYTQDKKQYQTLPKYPGIIYDIALALPKTVLWEEIKKEVSETSPLVKKVELFDVYEMKSFGPDQKSLAFHVYFQSPERTLVAAEAEGLRQKIVNLLIKKYKAVVR